MANPTPQDLNDQFQKLQRLATALGKNLSSFNLRPVAEDAAVVAELLGKWDQELNDITSSANDIATSFQSFVQQITKGNIALQGSKKLFNGLTSVAQEIGYHQQGINKLTSKDLANLEQKYKKAKEDASLNKTLAEQRKAELVAENQLQNVSLEQKRKNRKEIADLNAAISEATSIIDDTNTAYNDLGNTISRVKKEQEDVNELMGLGGAAVEGTEAALEKIGLGGLSEKLGLKEVKKKMEENAESIRAAGGDVNSFSNKFKVLKGGIKEAGSQLSSSLKDPMFIVVTLVKEMIDALKKMDGIAGDMAKNMNMSYEASLSLQNELNTIANLSGDINVQTESLGKSLMAVNQSLGSRAMLNKEDLVTMTKLTEAAGFQHDELMDIQKLSLAQGKSLEDNTKEALGAAQAYASQNKLIVNEKEVLKEVNKASATLKLSLKGSTAALAESVVKAKQFGLNLEQASKISEGLLNFEDSISQELNAELLTGKELNLEEARRLALNNDVAGAAAEVAKQVGTSADFAKMNAIQQEAIAKAAGLSREELAQSLIEREALAKLSGVEGKDAKERFDNLVKEVGLEEAKKRLGNDQLANQMQQQSMQERLEKSLSKIREVFISIATPVLEILEPIMELVTDILPAVNALLEPVIKIIRLIALSLKPIGVITKGIGDAINTYLVQPMQGLEEILGGIMDLFTGDFEKGFKKIGKGIITMIATPFQALMNLGTTVVNGMIDLVNKIPGVDISHVEGINIADKVNNLVGLATGGIVTQPTKALIGEAGPEAVVPLNQAGGNFLDKLNAKNSALEKMGLGVFKEKLDTDTLALIAKLDELIAVVSQGGEVKLDGTKVGTAMSVSTYKVQ